MPVTEKINVSRFCDLQGVNDFDRSMMLRKYVGLVAYYQEWYATVVKEGFEVGKLKPDFVNKPEQTEKK